MARSKAHTEFEFFGPPGAFIISFFLPILCYVFVFVCNDVSGCPAPALLHPYTSTFEDIKCDVGWPGIQGLLNTKALVATLGFYALSFLLYGILPAEEHEGTVLEKSGLRMKYRFNAWQSGITTLALAAAGTLLAGSDWIVWTFIWDNYVPIMTSNILISFALATYVYIQSFQITPTLEDRRRELAVGGNTGNILYDWFIGRELNPPFYIPGLGPVDIKTFMEVRPGILGWLILDLAFMARQYHNYSQVTDSMLIAVFSQAVYILDCLYNEPAIMTQIDIIRDGFGFMLSFGDLVWVPFTYTLQARYLAVYPVKLGLAGCLAIFAVQATGYYIFRASNNEKNRFRTNPDDPACKHLEYIETASGSKLLVSGWWGAARHINYLGDWILSWSYCLPTAIAGYIIRPSSPFALHDVLGTSPNGGKGAFLRNDRSLSGGVEVVPGEARGWGMLITYFYMVYFAVLLLHRERRDEEKCRKKYGKDWDEYTRRVRWRILPGVY